MIYLEKAELLWINRTFITEKGGIYFKEDENVLNRNSFEYLLEAPKLILFGVENYKTVHEKAAVYLFMIIKDHIFHDGNKRTGMMAAFLFLAKNGWKIRYEVSSQTIVSYAERVVQDPLGISDIANWLMEISEPGYL